MAGAMKRTYVVTFTVEVQASSEEEALRLGMEATESGPTFDDRWTVVEGK